MSPVAPPTRGERAADRVAAAVGSWRFIIIQSFVLMAWVAINVYLAGRHYHFNAWDPYPFVFLNLCLSLQAAYAAPILQLSGNRQTEKIETLAESTNELVQRLVRNDELHEQLAKNERDMLAALIELVKAHGLDDSR